MARNPFSRIQKDYSQEDIIRNLNGFFEQEWEGDLPSYQAVKEKISCEHIPLLLQIYAEAILFSSLVHNSIPSEIPEELKNYSVFGKNTPELKDLEEQAGAVAVFPTFSFSGTEQPKKWRLYVFQKKDKNTWKDHSHLLEYNHIIDPQTAIYLMDDSFQIPKQPLSGNSWQLAYRMAQRAIEQKNTKKTLAYNYLLTGTVHANEVGKVEIGEKTFLLEYSKRKLLYPAECKNEIPEKYQPKCRSVATVEHAWRFISGMGIEKINQISLPEKLQYLHLLVGGAIQPVLSVILQLNPEKIILWCSEETRNNGELIRETLLLIPKFSAEISIMSLDSHDLQSCYKKLRDTIFEQTCYKDTLISITGGNRLMGIAAQLTAQELNIKLVYRDIDAAEKNLTIIQFGEKNNYQSNDLYWNQCPFSDLIKWDWLYQKRRTQDHTCSSRQLLEQFYNL